MAHRESSLNKSRTSMKISRGALLGTVVLGLGLVLIQGREPAVGQLPTVRNGEIGFVISSFHGAGVASSTPAPWTRLMTIPISPGRTGGS